jgi:hypothetical protein
MAVNSAILHPRQHYARRVSMQVTTVGSSSFDIALPLMGNLPAQSPARRKVARAH